MQRHASFSASDLSRRTALGAVGAFAAVFGLGSRVQRVAAQDASADLAGHPLTGTWLAMANPPLPGDPHGRRLARLPGWDGSGNPRTLATVARSLHGERMLRVAGSAATQGEGMPAGAKAVRGGQIDPPRSGRGRADADHWSEKGDANECLRHDHAR